MKTPTSNLLFIIIYFEMNIYILLLVSQEQTHLDSAIILFDVFSVFHEQDAFQNIVQKIKRFCSAFKYCSLINRLVMFVILERS